MSKIILTTENVKEYHKGRQKSGVPIAKLCVDFIQKNRDKILADIEESNLAIKMVAYPLKDFMSIEWFNNPQIKAVKAEIEESITDFNIGFLRDSFENRNGKTYSQPWALELSIKA